MIPYLSTSSFIALVVTAVIVVASIVWVVLYQKKRQPLPPYSSASMRDNFEASGVQKSLFQLERYRKFIHEIKQGQFGSTVLGSTFRLRVPFVNPWIFTTDYVLARSVLAGNSKLGILEGERSQLVKFNFLDRNEHNLLTYLTSNKEREKARKDIAQAFSTSNLLHAWPSIRTVITDQFAVLRAHAAKGTVVDVKSTIVLFFMRTLSRGAFGVDFTDDGTENEHNINGLAYLQAFEDCGRERARQFMFPLRRFMFWEESVKRSEAAEKELRRMAEKILTLHQHDKEETKKRGESHLKPITVLDHVAHHVYSKEITRLSDVTLFSFAGIDTTSHTFCFFIMELSRHPQVQSRLQEELARFMPPLPSGRFEYSASNEKEMLSAIAGCEYLGYCVREVMRLWPVAASGPGRELLEDVEYGGMCLPKGSLVVAQLYSMFRERWIDRPEEFIPERWAESNPQLPQLKEMMMPFGLGKRNCIGQNMAMFQLKIVAAHFLHYFDFELACVPTFEYFVTLKPDDLRMRVSERV